MLRGALLWCNRIDPRMPDSTGPICRSLVNRHRPLIVVLSIIVLGAAILMMSGLTLAGSILTGALFTALGLLLSPALNLQSAYFGRSELGETRGRLEARTVQLTHLANELRHSEERARDFAEISSNWFWEQNAELRYTWFSEAVAHPGLHSI
jgi:hypothetical protein